MKTVYSIDTYESISSMLQDTDKKEEDRFVLREMAQNILEHGHRGEIRVNGRKIEILQEGGDFHALQVAIADAQNCSQIMGNMGLKMTQNLGWRLKVRKIRDLIYFVLIRNDSTHRVQQST